MDGLEDKFLPMKLTSETAFSKIAGLKLILIFFFFTFYFTWSIIRINGKTDKEELTKVNFLDQSYLTKTWPADIRNANVKIFEQRDLIRCFDELLNVKKQNMKKMSPARGLRDMKIEESTDPSHVNSTDVLHFAFVGDSRIRQIFLLFVESFPSYDRIVRPDEYSFMGNKLIRDEIFVYSHLYKVLVSYYWRSLLLDNDGHDQKEFFSHWISSNPDPQTLIANKVTKMPTPHPDVLTIGIELHHMLTQNPKEKVYFENLKELVPILQSLSETSQLVWLSQFPTLELIGNKNPTNNQVHRQKIWKFNLKADQIIRNAGIDLWTSASPLVDEYIRSCAVHNRSDGYFNRYFDCTDYIHPGTSALSDAMQMLFNKICNQ